MRVVQVTGFGGPEVLKVTDEPDPVAGPAEVIVEVSVADVLTVDTALRSGEGRKYFAIEPPFVPGTGVAGTVISVGDGRVRRHPGTGARGEVRAVWRQGAPTGDRRAVH